MKFSARNSKHSADRLLGRTIRVIRAIKAAFRAIMVIRAIRVIRMGNKKQLGFFGC